MNLSKRERRLGARPIALAPGDKRDAPSDSYRFPTAAEKIRDMPPGCPRERALISDTYADASPEEKKLADQMIAMKARLKAHE